MDLEDIKKLIALLNEEALTEIEVEDSESRIRLARAPAQFVGEAHALPPAVNAVGQASDAPLPAPLEADRRRQITSPIVGTFYKAASPDAEPYIKLGDTVKKGQVICVIEAMKLMNEIESDVDGKVAELCVDDGAAVEFGETLFFIEPA